MATRFTDHLLTGDHASRPAFGDVPQGTLYACSDHDLIYQSDGVSAWSTWADLSGSGSVATDAIFDAAGDLVQGTGADTGARLAAVATGKVLVSQGVATAVAWGFTPFHGAKAYNAGTQTILAGATDPILFGAEEYDSDAFHDTGSNTSRFTIPAGMGGKYRMLGQIYYAGTVTNVVGLWWRVDGTTVIRGSTVFSSVAGGTDQGDPILQSSAVAALTAGQYVELIGYNGTANTLTLGHASDLNLELAASIELIGA